MAAARPGALAFADDRMRCDFGTFEHRTDQLARAMGAAGVAAGDRVAALLQDGCALLELYFATAKLGAICVPLNWRLAAPEIAYILADARPKLGLVDSALAALLPAADFPVVSVTDNDAGAGAYAEFLQGGGEPPAAAAKDAPWLMLYTSGTTGRPKGCLLTQSGQMASTASSLAYWGVAADDTLLIGLPLFHVGGLGIVLTHFAAGAASVICRRHLGTADILDLAAAERARTLSISPTLLPELLARQSERPRDLVLRRCTMGGGMHEPALVQAVHEGLRAEIVAGYGQTEAGNFVTYLGAADQLARPTACGKPLGHLQARLLDEDGAAVADGEAGELCLRGPSVMTGYWQNKRATDAAIRDGWLRTGDVMRRDQDGFLHFVGRTKELIKTGGENVYPREVELVLLDHPAVRDCGVFGVADPQWGEAVKAAVVLHDGEAATAAELVAWCRARIAGYKRPRYVEFLPALPRSALGKLAVTELRARPVTDAQRPA
jgi:acyl-CoA synthetase (AMP-forming)/AMP-acid ligase II